MLRALLVIVVSLGASPAETAEKIVSETMPAGGRPRTCYVFVPDSTENRPSQINKDVWEFLKQQQLAGEPKYQVYAK